MNYIYNNIEILTTPVGSFTITDGEKAIPFSVTENSMNRPYTVDDDDYNVLGELTTETNYEIIIPSGDLEIGKVYTISFSNGVWEWCNTDDRTICYTTVIDDWAVGIGAHYPLCYEKEAQDIQYSKKHGFWNDRERDHLIVAPEQYDESEFITYSTDPLETWNGFTFKLYDRLMKYVYFKVAWIHIEDFPSPRYEGALGYWLT